MRNEEITKLTPKQELFCKEYIIDLNATQAALRAGYSEKGAHTQGHILLKDAKIKNYIQLLKDKRAARTEITADAVVKELARVAFGDISKIVEVDKDNKITVKRLNEIEDTAVIASISETVFRGKSTKTVKMWDKLKALHLLGQHLGVFADNKVMPEDDGKPRQTVIINVGHRTKGQMLPKKEKNG